MTPGEIIRQAPEGLRASPPSGPWGEQNFASPASLHEPGLADYWRILVKRKWVIFASIAVIVTLATIVSFQMTPMYEAVGRIAINREMSDILDLKDVGLGTTSEDLDYTVTLETQVRILQSDTLALEVVKNLQNQKHPAFADAATAAGGAVPVRQNDPARDVELIGRVRGGLRVTTIPSTRVIELRYMSSDPRLAAEMVNTLIKTYIEHNIRTRFEATKQASEWLDKELADLQMKVETAENKLVEYQRQHNIVGVDDKQNIVTTKLDDLNRQLTEAEADRIRKEADYKQVQAGNLEAAPALEQSDYVRRLMEQRSDLKAQLAEATTRFGPSYPKVQELSNKLAEAERSLSAELQRTAARMKNEYDAALTRESMLRARLERQKTEANRMSQNAIGYFDLKREAESNRRLYEGLLEKSKEAAVSAGLKASNIRVVDIARQPTSPSKPNIPRNIVLAFLVSMTGGVALAFLLEVLDTSVRTPEQVETLTSLPSLGIIPMSSTPLQQGGSKAKALLAARSDGTGKKQGVEIVAHTRPKSTVAESYRALRTSILLSSLGAPPKVVLVTSALPQEGKTTTSINTAIVMAQRGGRVLLIDADLRRPGVHKTLGITPRAGLSSLLTGSATIGEVIVRSPQLANLHVLPAGPQAPHPAELLGSELLRQHLETWKQEYDHIIIDTPPVLSVTDAVLLSVQADAVLVVIRSGQTTKTALRRARDLLVQVGARVVGVVVNAVDLNSPEHYYYYQYYDSSSKYYHN